MTRKQQQPAPIPAPPAATQPISLSQVRQSRQRGHAGQRLATTTQAAAEVLPLHPIGRGGMSAAEWFGFLALIREKTSLVGQLDPYKAHRGGYSQGGIDALQTLDALLDLGVDFETARASTRAYWLERVAAWVNAPDDPQEIIPLAPSQRHGAPGSNSSPTSPPPSA